MSPSTEAPRSPRPGRLTRLRQGMAGAGLDGLLISQPESRRYLSGYSAKDLPPRDSAGFLLITDTRQLVLTDPRTGAQAEQECPSFEVRVGSQSIRLVDLVRDAAQSTGVARLGFESNHLPYGTWQELSDALESVVALEPTSALVDELRVVKDPDEIAALRASAALNDAAFAHLARTLRAGCRERELAWEMETFVRSRGAEGLAFDPITVAGPNTAIPHAVPGDRAVQENELVLFDTGAKLGGYCSDMTRTVSMGAIDLRLDEIWKVVLDAQLEAEARVRPGMTGAEVDAIARGVIERAGYGEAFIHGLGHGVGLEIHEPPWLTRSRGSMPLLPGMVFTIEPGVYLPGVGGVRIEDMLLLTENGAAILSQAPKKLQLSEVLIDLDR